MWFLFPSAHSFWCAREFPQFHHSISLNFFSFFFLLLSYFPLFPERGWVRACMFLNMSPIFSMCVVSSTEWLVEQHCTARKRHCDRLYLWHRRARERGEERRGVQTREEKLWEERGQQRIPYAWWLLKESADCNPNLTLNIVFHCQIKGMGAIPKSSGWW